MVGRRRTRPASPEFCIAFCSLRAGSVPVVGGQPRRLRCRMDRSRVAGCFADACAGRSCPTRRGVAAAANPDRVTIRNNSCRFSLARSAGPDIGRKALPFQDRLSRSLTPQSHLLWDSRGDGPGLLDCCCGGLSAAVSSRAAILSLALFSTSSRTHATRFVPNGTRTGNRPARSIRSTCIRQNNTPRSRSSLNLTRRIEDPRIIPPVKACIPKLCL